MASDASNLLYLCPYCPQAFRVETDCRDHISELDDGGHNGVNGYDNDRTIEVRHPDIEEEPIEGWQDTVATALSESYEGEIEVPYEAIAEDHDLPQSFVAHELVYTHDREPVDGGGQRLKGKINLRWDQLTDKQQDTLLAWAYFPEKTHAELADMPLSGHDHQGSVSSTIRDHGWMLSHPDANAPISPREEPRHEGTETTEDDLGDLLDGIGLVGEDEDPEEVEPPEPVSIKSVGPEPSQEGYELWKWLIDEARVGPLAAGSLIMAGYETHEDLDRATFDDLLEVNNIGEKLAERIMFTPVDGDDESGTRSSGDEPRGKRAEDPVPDTATAEDVEEAVPDTDDEAVVSVSDMDLGFEAMCALIETDRYDEARKLFEEVVA